MTGNSRRYFLAQGAGLGFAGLLQGCGGDTASDAEAVAATGRSFTPLSSPLSVAAAGASPAMGAEFLQSVIYAGFHGRNDFDPYAALAANGVRWARTLVTTRSCPELDTVPVSRWGSTFGWKNEFWSCREMGAEVMRRAKAAGMKLQLGFYLSDDAAHAGTQKRPAAWSGLSDSQLAVKVGQYARETAAYFKSTGLAIDVFELGNETDFGLCGYQLSDTSAHLGRKSESCRRRSKSRVRSAGGVLHVLGGLGVASDFVECVAALPSRPLSACQVIWVC